MFKNILIPISSEFYSKAVLHRSVFLAEKFKSNISLIYIIEEKTLSQTDKISDSYRTHYDMAETKNEIISKQKQTADSIIFNDAKFYLKNKGILFDEKIEEGEFSIVIKNELIKKDYDLILMGFSNECVLNYRLLDEVDIPVWVEGQVTGDTILSICSNLAPNQKVPDLSLELSGLLDWKINMLYVVDIEDSVVVDEQGKRSEKKPERDLIFKGQSFVEEMKKRGVNIELVKGSLGKEINRAAEKINPTLIILGREQKKKGALGIPIKNVRKKIASKCKYSMLFLH